MLSKFGNITQYILIICNIILIKFKIIFKMDKTKEVEAKVQTKYKQAKELALADLKLILLGDSAVGKSK